MKKGKILKYNICDNVKPQFKESNIAIFQEMLKSYYTIAITYIMS